MSRIIIQNRSSTLTNGYMDVHAFFHLQFKETKGVSAVHPVFVDMKF